jgi:hypothetical protein
VIELDRATSMSGGGSFGDIGNKRSRAPPRMSGGGGDPAKVRALRYDGPLARPDRVVPRHRKCNATCS